jgi:hypothetical protein
LGNERQFFGPILNYKLDIDFPSKRRNPRKTTTNFRQLMDFFLFIDKWSNSR